MKHKVLKRSKKSNRKKRKVKAYGKKNIYGKPKTIDLQKVIDFKFQTFGKFYKNFSERRKKEKAKLENLKSRFYFFNQAGTYYQEVVHY